MNTKTTSRMCALYSAMTSIGFIFFYVFMLTSPGDKNPADPDYGTEKEGDIRYKVWFVFVAAYSMYFITSFMLINGIEKESPGLMLYFLIFLALFIVLDGGLNIFLVMKKGVLAVVFEFALFLATFIANIFVFVVVLLEYKATKIRRWEESINQDHNKMNHFFEEHLQPGQAGVDLNHFMEDEKQNHNKGGGETTTSVRFADTITVTRSNGPVDVGRAQRNHYEERAHTYGMENAGRNARYI